MNILVSIAAAIMMSAAATPSNPVILEHVQKFQQETKQNENLTVSYEETLLGDAVIMALNIPINTEEMSKIPTDMIKSEFVNNLKQDAGSVELIKALKETKTNLIIRLISSDKNNIDIIVSPDMWQI